jgi:hypothetical protein
MRTSLLCRALAFAALCPLAAQAWPDSATRGAIGPVSTACEDLSAEPITYGMEYDLPGSGLPGDVIDIHDIWLAGGCVGCHNSTAMGNLQIDDPQFAGYQLVYAPSTRDPEVYRVLPERPEDSLLYAQLNCTPPAPNVLMPPPDGPGLQRLSPRLRAMVYDWIAQGARGFDVDGLPYSDVVFRDTFESQRFQRNLAPNP